MKTRIRIVRSWLNAGEVKTRAIFFVSLWTRVNLDPIFTRLAFVDLEIAVAHTTAPIWHDDVRKEKFETVNKFIVTNLLWNVLCRWLLTATNSLNWNSKIPFIGIDKFRCRIKFLFAYSKTKWEFLTTGAICFDPWWEDWSLDDVRARTYPSRLMDDDGKQTEKTTLVIITDSNSASHNAHCTLCCILTMIAVKWFKIAWWWRIRTINSWST